MLSFAANPHQAFGRNANAWPPLPILTRQSPEAWPDCGPKFMAVVKNGHSVRIQTNDPVEEGFRPRFCVRLNFFVVDWTLPSLNSSHSSSLPLWKGPGTTCRCVRAAVPA